MDEELQLSYLVKNNAEPFGKPKVYFSYHPNDIDTLKHISEKIFAKQDCAIYYYDYSNGEPDQEELESLLREMLMFVVPVSEDYLTKPCTAYDFEYHIANTYSIPVLPLLQSRDIGRLCNQKMHNRQYLNELDDDLTAISFDTKLGLFLLHHTVHILQIRMAVYMA